MNEPLPLKWSENGLIPAIAQDVRTGQVLMQAYMSEESLRKTLETGTAWYWSRSRQELWNKGATSGHLQRVKEIRMDCDGDSLLLLVEQEGAACHEGTYTCFTRRVDGSPKALLGTAFWPVQPGNEAAYDIGTILREVTAVLVDRRAHPDPESYTSKLFTKGSDAYCKKIGEEATEVVLAVKNRDKENLAFEVADVWFHTLIALVDMGLDPQVVADQLASRRGKRRPPDYKKD
ncbi:MAG TPA: bifunctional phosphoribosyl-AMP cyclohydrolase/phosphoribosyl-ATP diphosphatase HisIE [Symbiobacteriaceae bacterium]|jgi:phosphoribosyl-ATP pyrophosphohydrolase/phosphoribosyl-AMP cyclohydrolase|nr:bifunctional phosphoribosyl-AMP cyclohydrolase/phosphoribosyl-ATP diphosphatase HisIE [Symbiobacteriaceae bacterium]